METITVNLLSKEFQGVCTYADYLHMNENELIRQFIFDLSQEDACPACKEAAYKWFKEREKLINN